MSEPSIVRAPDTTLPLEGRSHVRRRADADRVSPNGRRSVPPASVRAQRGAIAIEYLLLLLVMGIGVGVAFVQSTFQPNAGEHLKSAGESTLGVK